MNGLERASYLLIGINNVEQPDLTNYVLKQLFLQLKCPSCVCLRLRLTQDYVVPQIKKIVCAGVLDDACPKPKPCPVPKCPPPKECLRLNHLHHAQTTTR